MSYIGNQITGFLGTGSLTVTTSTVAVEGDALFSADGNVVLGDASGDTITINAATASIPNNLNIDSNTLFLNASNNRVGIGNASPATALDVTGRITTDGITSSGTYVVESTSYFIGNATNGYRFNNAADTLNLLVIKDSGNVGIGTSSPSGLAHVYNGMLQVGSKTGDTSIQQNANAIRIAAVPNSSTEWGGLQWYREFSDVIGAEIIASRPSSAETDTDLIFKTSTNSSNAVEVMRLNHQGNLGIGTSSPTVQLATGNRVLHLDSGTNQGSEIKLEGNSGLLSIGNTAAGAYFYNVSNTPAIFGTSNTERMRIDDNGLLLIGTTDTSPYNNSAGSSADNGVVVSAGRIWAARYSGTPMDLNRTSDDGTLIDFRKNGSVVGQIGVSGNGFFFGDEGDTGFVIDSNTDAIIPFNPSTRAVRDNAVDLGSSSGRFNDLYLGGKAIINRDSDDDFIQIQRGGTTRARIGITSTDNLYIDATTNGGAGLQFWGAGGSDPYITPREEGSDNDNVTSLGRGANRFKDLYLGGGLYVGGTGSANKLDDYEEGTWTVTLGRSGVTFSPSNTTGYYTKIGRLVYFTYYSGAITASATSQSGNTTFSGLPFTSANGTQQYHVFNYVHGNLFSSDVTGGYVNVNNTNAFFIIHDTVSAAVNVSIGSGRYLMISGVYEAA